AAPPSRRSRWPGSRLSRARIPSARRASRATHRRARRFALSLAGKSAGAGGHRITLLRSNHPACCSMMRICFPRRAITIVSLTAPRHPALAGATGEQFEIGRRAARFDDFILLIGLARVLAFTRRQQILLPPSRRQRARVPAAHAE